MRENEKERDRIGGNSIRRYIFLNGAVHCCQRSSEIYRSWVIRQKFSFSLWPLPEVPEQIVFTRWKSSLLSPNDSAHCGRGIAVMNAAEAMAHHCKHQNSKRCKQFMWSLHMCRQPFATCRHFLIAFRRPSKSRTSLGNLQCGHWEVISVIQQLPAKQSKLLHLPGLEEQWILRKQTQSMTNFRNLVPKKRSRSRIRQIWG